MRLDLYLVYKQLVVSRSAAQKLIVCGEVIVNGTAMKNKSYLVKADDLVMLSLKTELFASFGGEKLLKAIDEFDFDVCGKTFIDVGASNGGFTDCLLHLGARKVYAVDVGENQLCDRLKGDFRVEIMDNTNAKSLKAEMFAEEKLYIVADLSFISLTLLLGTFSMIADEMLLLIKPQFECGKSALDKKGVVKDRNVRLDGVMRVIEFASISGLSLCNLTIAGERTKNKEYMAYFAKNKQPLSVKEIESIVLC